MPNRGLQVYRRLIHERPYFMQAMQTASLMCLGDAISQYIAAKDHRSLFQINSYRMMKFGSIGLVLGPILTKWYSVLDGLNTGPLKIAFAKKIALDQLVFAPIALGCITAVVTLADGKSQEEVETKLKNDYFQILGTNYKIWPLVQCFNFSIVPLDYRVLVTQSVAVGWNAYLSWKLNSKST